MSTLTDPSSMPDIGWGFPRAKTGSGEAKLHQSQLHNDLIQPPVMTVSSMEWMCVWSAE